MTSTTLSAGEVIQTDVLGRVRVSRARREALLDEFERGGASGQAFAVMAGIKYPTFATWVQARRRARGEYAPGATGPKALPGSSWPEAVAALRLVEAVVESGTPAVAATTHPETGGVALYIHLPGGAHAEVADAGQARLAAELLRALVALSPQHPPMLSFSGSLRVFVALEPCDLRKSFEGLAALVTNQLGERVKSGALFVFSNRKHTRLKILYWDGSGLWVMTKRLEEGTFAWPRSVEPNAVKLRLRPEALAMLTDGVELRGARLRPWYEREEAAAASTTP